MVHAQWTTVSFAFDRNWPTASHRCFEIAAQFVKELFAVHRYADGAGSQPPMHPPHHADLLDRLVRHHLVAIGDDAPGDRQLLEHDAR